ncbi:hypothetical protein [Xanthobacter agilis]|jgi:hypothetical protein|uniref:Uncharacterized protein n=1 Tax=Xanthobacter agilis TaxID=47492 RepID=A0ABU0LDL1_XANAG|nr:hypothetical protein [Xanthobacter agilis]MDQ0505187.1 hypothetical protein [Xanthobacter agilis]
MKTYLVAAAVSALVALGAGGAVAQPQPTATETVVIAGVGTVPVLVYQARFVSADPATRRMVLELPNGKRWAIVAPPILGDLEAYRNSERLLIRVVPGIVTGLGKARQGTPGEVLSEVAINDGLPGWPEGFGIRAVTLTTIFVDVNRQAGTVTFEGPDGGVRTLRAVDPKVLADLQQVNPGDLAQISYLEGIAINAGR